MLREAPYQETRDLGIWFAFWRIGFMLIKAKLSIAVRTLSCHRVFILRSSFILVLLWINMPGFSLLGVPQSRFMYSILKVYAASNSFSPPKDVEFSSLLISEIS